MTDAVRLPLKPETARMPGCAGNAVVTGKPALLVLSVVKQNFRAAKIVSARDLPLCFFRCPVPTGSGTG